MAADFDRAAIGYDKTFTNTAIGRGQRQVVWKRLGRILARGHSKQSILELNCGTGEDAKYLGELGHEVLATDISTEMLAVTQGKCRALPNVTTQQLDLTTLPHLSQQFDLIFSNFGGLNCLDSNQLRRFANWSQSHLVDGGSLILVIMPRDTLIEQWYRRFKGDRQSLRLRQSQNPTQVNVDGQLVQTYFFNPDEVTEIFEGYEVKTLKATGYVPSYWSGHWLESVLLLFSRVFSILSIGGRYGDHYLVELVKSTDDVT